MHNLSVKKAGIFALSIFIAVSLAGCTPGKDGDTEIKAVDAGLTAAPEERGRRQQRDGNNVFRRNDRSDAAAVFSGRPIRPEVRRRKGTGRTERIPYQRRRMRMPATALFQPPSEGSGEAYSDRNRTSEPVTDERMQSLLSGLAFPSANGSWSSLCVQYLRKYGRKH